MEMKFTKMVASGNDFVVVTMDNLSVIAKRACDRKYGIGADGLLVLSKSKIADVRMRIFNADGSEAEMCGNGARCAARYMAYTLSAKRYTLKIETKAGIIDALVSTDSVKIKLTEPRDLKLNFPVRVNGRTMRINFVNTGVPHAVVFAQGLDKINISGIAPLIRYHKKFAPAGTNVDFVEVLNNKSIKVRTYERGVEDETLACGTGSAASALLTTYHLGLTTNKINVHTKSGEILKVYFNRVGDNFKDVWLEGAAKIVYRGVYNV